MEGLIWLTGKELREELGCAENRELAEVSAEVTEDKAVSDTGVWTAAAVRAARAAAMPN